SEYFEVLKQGNETAAMELFNQGADIFRITKDGANALHYAAMGANTGLILFLLEKGVKPNARTRQGLTAVSICCETGNLEGLNLLLEFGETLAETKEDQEGYLVERGIRGNNPELVAFLIKNGISTEFQSRENFNTPLTWVVYWKNFELAKTLLEGGANANAMGKDGDSPLYAAHQRKNQPLVDLLLSYGADPRRLPGPCHICGKTFFSGSYQIGQSDFANVDWHCLWCGFPTCSDCAGVRLGASIDREHKICKTCMAESQLDRDKVENGLDTIRRWAHHRENIGKTRKTFSCPVCRRSFDLALAVNRFASCTHHDHICQGCMPVGKGCPLCSQLKRG
ncbi:MAG: ankyrin repeat domain-containing protein, partial [Candidatus Riflebacteria bacterium]|nr:ankyrin repeat domain-containing protein [Candidatus Riflebacteria bacterium]